MNLTADDVTAGALRDRVHAGASMADIEPMEVDRTVCLLVNSLIHSLVNLFIHSLTHSYIHQWESDGAVYRQVG